MYEALSTQSTPEKILINLDHNSSTYFIVPNTPSAQIIVDELSLEFDNDIYGYVIDDIESPKFIRKLKSVQGSGTVYTKSTELKEQEYLIKAEILLHKTKEKLFSSTFKVAKYLYQGSSAFKNDKSVTADEFYISIGLTARRGQELLKLGKFLYKHKFDSANVRAYSKIQLLSLSTLDNIGAELIQQGHTISCRNIQKIKPYATELKELSGVTLISKVEEILCNEDDTTEDDAISADSNENIKKKKKKKKKKNKKSKSYSSSRRSSGQGTICDDEDVAEVDESEDGNDFNTNYQSFVSSWSLFFDENKEIQEVDGCNDIIDEMTKIKKQLSRLIKHLASLI